MTVQKGQLANRASLDALTAVLNTGTAVLEIWDTVTSGGSIPTTADDADDVNNLKIASLGTSNPAFDAASDSNDDATAASGQASFEYTADASAVAGTGAYFRLRTVADGQVMCQGTVSAVTGGGDLEFSPTNVFTTDGTVSVSQLNLILPE